MEDEMREYDFTNFMNGRGERERSIEEIRDVAYRLSLVINSLTCEFHSDRHNDDKIKRELGDGWSGAWHAFQWAQNKMLPVVTANENAAV
jgi:hypothetical protein